MVTANFPTHVHIAIIGAGIEGTAHARELALAGERDIALFDKGDPQMPQMTFPYTGGASNHSSGFVVLTTPGSRLETKGRVYGAEVYSQISQASVAAGGPECWRETGTLEFATSDKRVRDLYKRQDFGDWCGVESEILTPSQAYELFPLLDVNSVQKALYTPKGGIVDVTEAMKLMMQEARDMGAATVYSNTKVTGFEFHDNGRARLIHTTGGDVEADIFIIAAGVWSGLIAEEMLGVPMSMSPLEHANMKMGPFEALLDQSAATRNPIVCRHQELGVYWFEHGGGRFEVGDYSPHFPARLVEAKNIEVWRTFKAGYTVTMREMDYVWAAEYIAGPVEWASRVVPFLQEILDEEKGARIPRDGFNGLVPVGWYEAPMVGPMPGIPNVFFAGRGWANNACANALENTEFIVDGRTKWETFTERVSRYYPEQSIPALRTPRLEEQQLWVYALPMPGDQFDTSRQSWVPPYYERLVELGGVFREVVTKERGHWYEANERILKQLLAEGYYIPDRVAGSEEASNWSRIIGAEHLWQRMHAGITDLASFFIFDVEGPGALAFMQYMVVNNVDVAWPNENSNFTGRAVYTQFLDDAGQLKGDIVVLRLAFEHFRVVTGAMVGMDNYDWFDAHRSGFDSVHLEDMTMHLDKDTSNALCVLSLWGPRAWAILKAAIGYELRDGNFRYLSHKEVTIAGVPVRALRIGFTGEQGVELQIPWDAGLAVWDALWMHGQKHELIATGLGTYVDSMSLEELNGLWGEHSEFNTEHNPYELGIFKDEARYGKKGMTKFKTGFDFIGRIPSFDRRDHPPVRILSTMQIEYPTDFPGRVPIGNWTVRHPLTRELLVAGQTPDGDDYHSAIVRVDTAYSLSAQARKHIVLARTMLPEWHARIGNEGLIPYYDELIPGTVVRTDNTSLHDPENTFART